MSTRWTRFLKLFHPQAFPWPLSQLYSAISARPAWRRHYELVALHVAQHGAPESILDVGTGPARLLLELRRALPQARLVGCDISPAMLRKAEKNLRRADCHRAVELTVGSAESLPFPDESFDCVVSTGSLHHWKDHAAAIEEAHRVLKPGGRALVCDAVRNMPPDAARSFRRDFGYIRWLLVRLLSFAEPFLDPDELLDLARASSFGGGEVWFTGALCCQAMTKAGHPPPGLDSAAGEGG